MPLTLETPQKWVVFVKELREVLLYLSRTPDRPYPREGEDKEDKAMFDRFNRICEDCLFTEGAMDELNRWYFDPPYVTSHVPATCCKKYLQEVHDKEKTTRQGFVFIWLEMHGYPTK